MTNQLIKDDNNIVPFAVEIHRNFNAEPRSFLSLCSTYQSIIDKKMKSRGS